MKNSLSFIKMFPVCCLFYVVSGRGQVLNNKLNIYQEYSIGLPSTKQFVNNGSFQFPSLYNNLKMSAISIRGLYCVHSNVSVGVEIEVMKGSDWSLASSAIYRGARTSFTFLSPVVQFHKSFQEEGIFNRLKLYASVRPIFGFASINISRPLSDAQYEGIEIFESGLSSKTNTRGFSGAIGMELRVDQRVGFTTSYSFARHWLQSSLCMDKGFNRSMVNLGIYYRILRDKRYYY